MSWELARLPVRIYAGPTPGRIDGSAPVAVVRDGTEATVTTPDPTRAVYFEVVPRGATHGPIVGDRLLGLEGAPNSRDLGGYQTRDGRRTRWGRLFRTDGLATATDGDRERLAALGLPDTCPNADDQDGPVEDATLLAAAESVTGTAARERDRAFLRRLARDPLPHWVQCTRFDDRSGWPAALVLATLGVSRETIVADHLQSARGGAPPPPDRRYVDAAFETIRGRYETFGRYLAKGLRIDDRTARALRARFTSADGR